MDLTQGTLKEKNSRAKKMMLWFGLIALFMSFAGLTSAVIISRKRPDWSQELELPQVFLISVFVILASSVAYILAQRALKNNNRKLTTSFLLLSFILGVIFIFLQFQGFKALIDSGYYFTGQTSDPKASFIFLIAFFHLLHVAVGLICLLVVIYNHFKQKYTANNMLGMELAGTFWHFIDILWVFLYLLMYFVG
ncbi:cytochrome c oxidase subunit 3 [Lacinutrix venerupis]|uniref:Cytochrome oxidase subunit III n=1 Tax=Lacinutrix venerupis TaxID=1486034 RepID=A0AAC9LJN7_9FLAO|nr:cytochrome c oxidase subunit 3 [Lacinutrix venerupis]APX99338.1 cytochrome oxidase subunit III [Lacinutrix venerupis]RLJ65726.1 cytochrome c oxidase subunit 3 [Lacinutrix venerupis]